MPDSIRHPRLRFLASRQAVPGRGSYCGGLRFAPTPLRCSAWGRRRSNSYGRLPCGKRVLKFRSAAHCGLISGLCSCRSKSAAGPDGHSRSRCSSPCGLARSSPRVQQSCQLTVSPLRHHFIDSPAHSLGRLVRSMLQSVSRCSPVGLEGDGGKAPSHAGERMARAEAQRISW